MELNERQSRKAEPALREALEQAEGSEVLQAIVVLGDDRADLDAAPQASPADFPSRDAYRAALIEQRRRQLAAALGPTLQQLRDLDLEPTGGTNTRTVVIEGPARRILASLELPGVQHASLDRPISLIQPRRARRRKA